MEAALKVVGINIKTVDDKYAPIKKSLSRITWIVIGVVIPLVVISVIQLLSNVIPKGGA
jgi:Mg/Co/Ni transporter MgtE